MADLVFRIGSSLAVLAWLALIASVFVRQIRPAVRTGVRYGVISLMAVAYVALIVTSREAFAQGGFGNLQAVRTLFAHDGALTAGWLHYLAFDLFVGVWIVERSGEGLVHRLLIIPVLLLTFLFGPAGLLGAYLMPRAPKPSVSAAV